MINTNVVEASRRAHARKIAVMGTGAVYPFPSPGLPLKEDMIFLGRPHPAHAGYANASAQCSPCLKHMKRVTA
jgi:GDP-L-fucose synthase